MVRQVSASLQTHLDSGVTTLSWCWRLTKTDGIKLGFTDHDDPITLLGTVFEASSGITASEIDSSLGLNIDNLDIQGAMQSDRITEQDIAAGLYDNAFVEIFRVNWIDPSQHILIKTGNMGELKRTQKAFVSEMRGISHELQQDQGRIFQYSCDADLGDARCAKDVSGSTFTSSATVSEVTCNQIFKCTGLSSFERDWFTHGLINWLSGQNLGRYMEIKKHVITEGGDVIFTLWQGMAYDVQVGHTFNAITGCNKQPETCRDKFSNMINYQGFPSMPGNDFITSYPTRDDPANDGGVL